MQEHILKLLPGEDFITSVFQYCKKHHIEGAYIATCVGSFERVVFRKGYDQTLFTLDGPFEIVSMEGTLSNKGMHIHTAVSDKNFKVYGGHIIAGTTVKHTAELIIIELSGHQLSRSKSEISGFKELQIQESSKICKE